MAGNSIGSEKKKRGPGRPFQKGQSGNPLGRPALPDWFRKKGPEALKYMMKVAEGEVDDPKVSRYEACSEMAERIYGKAPQAVELSGNLETGNTQFLEGQKRVERRLDEILKRNGR